MKKFKKLTLGNGNNAIIMGRNTYESIKKPLPNRDNLILSSQIKLNKIKNGNNIVKDFLNIESLKEFLKTKTYDEIWIIGGVQIYELFLTPKTNDKFLEVNKIYLTYT